MQVHIFRAIGRVFGFTLDDTGANLPADLGRWSHFKAMPLMRVNPVPGVDVQACLDDIERHGFHLTDAHVRITDRFVEND